MAARGVAAVETGRGVMGAMGRMNFYGMLVDTLWSVVSMSGADRLTVFSSSFSVSVRPSAFCPCHPVKVVAKVVVSIWQQVVVSIWPRRHETTRFDV